jgi:hypothetical protein
MGVDEPGPDHPRFRGDGEQHERPQRGWVERDERGRGGGENSDRGQVHLADGGGAPPSDCSGHGGRPGEEPSHTGPDMYGEKNGTQHGEYLPMWMIGVSERNMPLWTVT